jgi:hypothetical protein
LTFAHGGTDVGAKIRFVGDHYSPIVSASKCRVRWTKNNRNLPCRLPASALVFADIAARKLMFLLRKSFDLEHSFLRHCPTGTSSHSRATAQGRVASDAELRPQTTNRIRAQFNAGGYTESARPSFGKPFRL